MVPPSGWCGVVDVGWLVLVGILNLLVSFRWPTVDNCLTKLCSMPLKWSKLKKWLKSNSGLTEQRLLTAKVQVQFPRQAKERRMLRQASEAP